MRSLLFTLAFTRSDRLVAELAMHLDAWYRPPARA